MSGEARPLTQDERDELREWCELTGQRFCTRVRWYQTTWLRAINAIGLGLWVAMALWYSAVAIIPGHAMECGLDLLAAPLFWTLLAASVAVYFLILACQRLRDLV